MKDNKFSSSGLPDSAFYRGKAPMTKSEVRAITLSKMRLLSDSNVLDIGAGSGSITVEAALVANEGKVWGIERKLDAYEVFLENKKRFERENIIPILGHAPEDLPDVSLDAIVVGGSGGMMNEIIEYAKQHLVSGGRFVVNAITVETAYLAIQGLKGADEFRDVEVIQVQVSKGRNIGSLTMMEALNPIYVISAELK